MTTTTTSSFPTTTSPNPLQCINTKIRISSSFPLDVHAREKRRNAQSFEHQQQTIIAETEPSKSQKRPKAQSSKMTCAQTRFPPDPMLLLAPAATSSQKSDRAKLKRNRPRGYKAVACVGVALWLFGDSIAEGAPFSACHMSKHMFWWCVWMVNRGDDGVSRERRSSLYDLCEPSCRVWFPHVGLLPDSQYPKLTSVWSVSVIFTL